MHVFSCGSRGGCTPRLHQNWQIVSFKKITNSQFQFGNAAIVSESSPPARFTWFGLNKKEWCIVAFLLLVHFCVRADCRFIFSGGHKVLVKKEKVVRRVISPACNCTASVIAADGRLEPGQNTASIIFYCNITANWLKWWSVHCPLRRRPAHYHVL